MARSLITYHGPGMPDDPAAAEQAKAAFGRWVMEAGDALIDPGGPVRMVGQVSTGSSHQPAQIGGYSIIEADTREAAEALLRTHPYVARGRTLQLNQLVDV